MIVVIGGGIAGLSVAYELLQRGTQVTVVEAKTIASGASGVATSYLEPRLGNTAMRAIEREAMRRWEDYAATLSSIGSTDVGFRREGQIKVTLAENLKRLEKDLDAREAQEAQFKRLSMTELNALEPALSSDIIAAAHLPDVRWVTGRHVCQALATAIGNHDNGTVLEEFPVAALEHNGTGVNVVGSDGTQLRASKTIISTGIGEPGIEGMPDDVPQSRPVRGVNLVLDQSSLEKPITHLIKHHRGNMCPRAGGELIVGTTYEAGESSLDPGPDVVEFLYQNAEPILPTVRQLPLLRVTAGLRSKVGDGNLRLGRSAQMPSLYYSLSHGGAGYLRAPVIAAELADFVLTGEPGKLPHEHTHL